MTKISLLDKKKKAITSDTEVRDTNMYGNISQESIQRDTQRSTINLPLNQLEEFEFNVRLEFPEEEMKLLEESISQRWLIDEISVVHIKKGDRYIIADWHRTKRVLTKLFGPKYEVEVMIRKEFDNYDKEAIKYLMEVCFVTSTLKAKLSVYEELEGILKYIDVLKETSWNDNIKLSQVQVYSILGYSKSKAMKLARVIETVGRENFSKFKDQEISYNLLQKFSEILDQIWDWVNSQWLKAYLYNSLENWVIENAQDLTAAAKIFTDLKSTLPVMENQDEIVAEITDNKLKENKKELENLNLDDNRYLKDLLWISKKLWHVLLSIDFDTLNEESKKIFTDTINKMKNLLEDYES